ncbi:zinc finger MYM-type protein 1-like, partial [Daktulosphaira vitifoliae]|uniref:zinc finger MYM-type protein 1-like n=1 Tax=Daktulosphaira vitifoliae TaxID=58002 RepID=UPI0021AA0FF9
MEKKLLKFQYSWLEKWNWLAYSKVKDGAYCKYCVLFSQSKGGKGSQPLGQLCTEAFNKWKHAVERFNNHDKANYHQNSIIDFQSITAIIAGKSDTVYHQLNKAEKIQKENNRKIIVPVIESVLLCGRQGIELRGHRDSGVLNLEDPLINEGNFRALLRFFLKATTKSGDESFLLARENCTDETADISGIEQFALCARYYDSKTKNIHEDFLKFVPVYDVSGKSLANYIITELKELNIEVENLRGQGYDGTASMSGKFNGVAALIKKEQPKALYVHCSAHNLNLSVSNS